MHLPLIFALLLGAPQDPAPPQSGPAPLPATAPADGAKRSPADARILVAKQAYEQGNYPRAEKELMAAAELEPKRADVFGLLGAVRFRMRRYKDSIEAWEKAVQLDPKWLGDAQPAGHCLSALGQLDEAVAWYKKVLAVKPNNREALRGIGVALEKLGKLEDSEKYLRDAVAIDPDYPPALLALGRTLVRKHESASALVYLEKAKKSDPFEPDVEYELTRAYRELGQESKAAAAAERQAFLAQRRATIDTLRNRLLATPNDVSAVVALADAYEQIGDVANSRTMWNRAMALGRDDGRVRAARAVALVQQGSYQTAEKILLEFIKGHGTDVAAWEALWYVRKEKGDAAGADEAAAFVRKLAQREPQAPKLPKLDLRPADGAPESGPASAPAK